MLKVANLCKKYNENQVLHHVNLQVERGEIHGLLGANGSGKTTLIKCLNGMFKPDEGTVTYENREIFDAPEVKQTIAYVSEQQDFISAYSVENMVRFYDNFYDNFSKDKFEKLNEKFKLNKKNNVSNLSKGSKTKLAFMLAIAQNPEYLIMDEPESGLDADSRKLFRDILIEEVDTNKIGVIFSSHNLHDVENMCDSVTIIDNGKVLCQKPLDTLMNEFQKWNVVLEDESVLKETDFVLLSRVGKMTELYTFGNRETNQKILKNVGADQIEGQRVTLEEICRLVRKG